MNGSPVLPDDLKSLRALLVDDDGFVLDLVEGMLHELGIANVSRTIDGTWRCYPSSARTSRRIC